MQAAVWAGRRNDPSLALWAAGNFVGGCAAILIALRNALPELVSVAGANALLVLSLSLVWAGMRRFFGRPVSAPFLLVPALLTVLLLGFVPVVAHDYALRVVVTSLLLASINLAIALELLRDRRLELLRARVFLIWVFGLTGLFYLWRSWAARNFQPELNVLVPDPVTGLTLLVGNLKLLAWNLGALMMANERMQNRLVHAASCDALTNVLNRAGFRDLSGRELQRAMDSQRPASVLLMDLDRFKSVNDRYGHDAGDRVLCSFAETARQALRPTDLLARFGGEEFCALLPDADEERAAALAERVRASFAARTLDVGGESLRVTVSIGVARIAMPDEAIHAALARADAALYRAKAEGRDRVVMAPA